MGDTIRTLLKGAALLSIGQVAGYGLSFVRNLILARLLTKADFGLAAALAMTISLLELVGRMAFGIQSIQARNGDEPEFQAVAHAVQMAFGVGSALIVVAGAYPMARAFGVPELTWAFALLSVVPLARGAMHLDLFRLQRHLQYKPFVLMEVLTQSLATAAAWPLAIWLGDFRAVLYIMLGKESLSVIFSHLLSERPYRWAWASGQVRQMLIFGWPLLLNGLVMFASQQGDQMLVGATFPLAELASYSIAFTLTSIPFLILGQVGSSLMLPTLSRYQDSPTQFQNHYCRCLELSVVLPMLLLGPMIVAGGDIVRLLYGPKYSDVGGLMAVFAAIVALRFFRWAPSVASMSKADTLNQLLGNIARSVSFLLALVVVFLGTKNLLLVASCGLAGEAVAIGVTVYRIKKRTFIKPILHLKPIFFLVSWISLGVVVHQWLGVGSSNWVWGGTAVLFCFLGLSVSLFYFPALSTICKHLLQT
jgi:O-antigen/teichoic acid export membrane protein